MEQNNNFIPILSKKIDIHEVETDRFLIQQKEFGYSLYVDKETVNILNLIDNKKTIIDICDSYYRIYKKEVPIDVAYKLLHNQLPKYGIIKSRDLIPRSKQREKYLFLSFVFINKKYANKIANKLSFLFRKKILIPIFIFTSLFSIATFFLNINKYQSNYNLIFDSDFFYAILFMYCIFIIHEFGHAAAGQFFGAESKGIGFGFYMVLPVFFADMTDVWKLKRNEKITVNLGGIYFDFINSAILAALYLFTNNLIFLIVLGIVLFTILNNLNFLFKFDGYWIVSDFLRIPNLRMKSISKLNAFIRKIRKKEAIQFTKKDYFLVVYALISLSYIFIVIFIILVLFPNDLLLYPLKIKEAIDGNLNFSTLKPYQIIRKFIIPSLFYFTLIKIIYQRIKLLLKK